MLRVGRAARFASLLAMVVAVAVAGCAPAVEQPLPSTPGTPEAIGTPAPPATPEQSWVGAPPMAASRPVRVQIPAIGVDSELMDLGLADDGAMEVPPTGFPAGWFTGAPTPGELGPAIVVGHVDWDGPAVFHDLVALAPDDEVVITREDGSTATFRVTRVEQYPKAAFPTDEVYGDIDHAGLRMITCGGYFDRAAASHHDNIVVFAALDR